MQVSVHDIRIEKEVGEGKLWQVESRGRISSARSLGV